MSGDRFTIVATAPGRVNLIGEHTDYNGGFVLPAAIPQRTRVELSIREDRRVRATSANAPGNVEEFMLGQERRRNGWLDYVQGVTWALSEAGHELGGFDVRISSEIPMGAGLSSSAALEIALLRALRDAFALAIDDVTLARLAQRGENGLVGAPVGLMDPMACLLADERNALFLDTRTLEWRRVPIPPSLELAVISSGIAHRLATGDYRTRRHECERAAEMLGVRELRDVSRADLPRIDALPSPFGKRARHVVTENARVLDAVAALERADAAALGELLDASHRSLRDDFEVSLAEIDVLVECVRRQPGVWGARITGGGFGGSIVALCDLGMARASADAALRLYVDRTAEAGRVWVPRGADSAG
jgi:galactokinase